MRVEDIRKRFPGIDYIQELANKQLEAYRVQSVEVAAHFNREQAALDSYRGRQLLELLQNADDACEDYDGEKKLLFRLTKEYLIIANTGHPFTKQGIESLVISDNSPKQLKRTRYIGNKGLGFRAVLSWSHTPSVASGDFLVAFSASHARNSVKRLSAELPDLQSLLSDWAKAGRDCPAATMRFPYVPGIEHVHVRVALDVIREGYNTVILLPLPESPKQKEIYNEINTQLKNISGEIAIFCYHLEKLIVQSEGERSWELIREKHDERQTLIIQDGADHQLWTVYRREYHLPEELLNHELRRTPEFEVAVAVPEDTSGRRDHKLCVYFPTNEVLPMALLCHASLDTDDSRNRLVKHDANKYVLTTLARFIVEIAQAETTIDMPHRGLSLLAGIEQCDPELSEMGLRDTAIEAARQSNLFYRLDGTFTSADKVHCPPNPIWFDIATAEQFPEILRLPEDTNVRSFLDTIKILWYEDHVLSQLLEKYVSTLPSVKAGAYVGKLILNKQVPRRPLPSLLIGEACTILPASMTAFLPAESETVQLPEWVKDFSFLDRSFVDSLRTELAVQSVRDLRNQFTSLGYHVEEFQLETVARQLIDEANKRGAETPENMSSLHTDVLRFIYEMAKLQGDIDSPIKTPLNVITTQGTLQRAADCYLGPDYPRGQLVFDLYSNLSKDEFIAAPDVFGLAGDINSIETFLIRIGVARSPRIKKISEGSFRVRSTPLTDLLRECPGVRQLLYN